MIVENITYDTPLKVVWNWQSYIIEDQDNWHGSLDLVNKQTIFKSVNNILTVKPELLGTQTVEMKCIDVYGNRLINHGEGAVYVKGDGKRIINRAEQETRDVYYRDVYIVGFKGFATVDTALSSDGESANISPVIEDPDTIDSSTYGSTSNKNNLNINYTIYYNDGTVIKNKGASVQLFTASGKPSKTNKVKISVGKSIHAHKHKCANIKGLFKIDKPHKRDLVKPEIEFNADVLQYGYSKTINIYNFKYNIDTISADGIEELTNDIVSSLINDVYYKSIRSENENEVVSGNSLRETNLILKSFKYIDDSFGIVNNIKKNELGYKHIGIL